jgi:hypothetical protein
VISLYSTNGSRLSIVRIGRCFEASTSTLAVGLLGLLLKAVSDCLKRSNNQVFLYLPHYSNSHLPSNIESHYPNELFLHLTPPQSPSGSKPYVSYIIFECLYATCDLRPLHRAVPPCKETWQWRFRRSVPRSRLHHWRCSGCQVREAEQCTFFASTRACAVYTAERKTRSAQVVYVYV